MKIDESLGPPPAAEKIELTLSNEELRTLGGLSTERAAVEICKIAFRRRDPHVEFLKPTRGADLRIKFPANAAFDIEVKGTKSDDIAWNQIRVSSQTSHDLLRDGMPLYRVAGVASPHVQITILLYGMDFNMTPEPRWRVHPLNQD